MKRHSVPIAILVTLLLAAPQLSMADPHGHGGGYGGRHGGGHDWHGDWSPWWIIPPLLYLSTQPRYNDYSYPAPVVAVPNVVIVPQPAEPAPQLQTAPTTAYWYYCDAAQGYYPYVAFCPAGWRAVPATPPDMRYSR